MVVFQIVEETVIDIKLVPKVVEETKIVSFLVYQFAFMVERSDTKKSVSLQILVVSF